LSTSAGVADQYRKIRNTFRYLLGALDGFEESERLDVAEMPELERYMLVLTALLDARLRKAVTDYDFNGYVRALSDFCNNDLSAFFFDIRKDSLYCDAPTDPKRRAYRTVLDTMFHALVRWLSPVLVFTTEEVWGTRYPDGGSVHLLEWPEIDTEWRENDALEAKWTALRELRETVTEAIEPLRREKVIGSSLEAEVTVPSDADPALLAELFIVSSVRKGDALSVTKTDKLKCGRCWRHLPEDAEDGALCARCEDVVNG
jgi:isoleucyl-tRNA synthetase